MLCHVLFGQFHEDVFPGESGAALITKLRLEYRPPVVLEYGPAREVMYTKLYNTNDSVRCVYSGHKLYLDPGSQNPIGDMSMGGSPNGINCEHTFPQSKGAGSGNARSDMHHLFPSRARVNEARLNYPFEEIDDRNTETWYISDREQSSIPTENIDAYSERGDEEFEPREDHKGNVARAIFYFYTVYRSTADASFFSGQRATLCQWHYDDPVDSLEWFNNQVIATYQSDKKNPFILDCSLAERTYCPDVINLCQTTAVNNINLIGARVYPNPNDGRFNLDYDQIKEDMLLQISDLNGRTIHKDTLQEGSVSSNLDLPATSGVYQIFIISLTSGKVFLRHRFVVR